MLNKLLNYTIFLNEIFWVAAASLEKRACTIGWELTEKSAKIIHRG